MKYQSLSLTLSLLVLLLLAGGVKRAEGNKDEVLKKILETHIHAYYPEYDLYQLKDMDDEGKGVFLRDVAGGNPGYVCLSFPEGYVNCGVLIKKTNKDLGAAKLLLFENILGGSVKKVLLEDYEDVRDLKCPGCRLVYLRFQKKANIDNHDPDRMIDEIIEMKSDGFEIVFYEKASRVYYWDNGVVKMIITSD